MGIAALVLGIVSIIIGFIPFCGVIAFVPAVVGLVLGIIDIVKKSKTEESKGMAIAGTVLSGLAIIIIGYWLFIVGAAASATGDFINEIDTNLLYNQIAE